MTKAILTTYVTLVLALAPPAFGQEHFPVQQTPPLGHID